MQELLTYGQKDRIEETYRGHPEYEKVVNLSRTLDKKEAGVIISMFHGHSWDQYRLNPNEDIRERAKSLLTLALERIKSSKKCPRCHKPYAECNTCD